MTDYPILHYQYAKLIALVIVAVMAHDTCVFLGSIVPKKEVKERTFADAVYAVHNKRRMR